MRSGEGFLLVFSLTDRSRYEKGASESHFTKCCFVYLKGDFKFLILWNQIAEVNL